MVRIVAEGWYGPTAHLSDKRHKSGVIMIESETLRFMPRQYHAEYLNDDGTFDCPMCGVRTFDSVVIKHNKVCVNCASGCADSKTKRENEYEDEN